jgi:hypothetical protein
MDRFAVIVGGVVENVVLWDPARDAWHPPPGRTAVKCTAPVAPGWSYAEGAFTSPALPPRPRQEKTQFSVREFRSRFRLEEQAAIRAASLEDMEVGLVYDAFNAADFVDVTDSDTVDGVDLFIRKGLLAEARREMLLAPEIVSEAAPLEQVVEGALSDEIHSNS